MTEYGRDIYYDEALRRNRTCEFVCKSGPDLFCKLKCPAYKAFPTTTDISEQITNIVLNVTLSTEAGDSPIHKSVFLYYFVILSVAILCLCLFFSLIKRYSCPLQHLTHIIQIKKPVVSETSYKSGQSLMCTTLTNIREDTQAEASPLVSEANGSHPTKTKKDSNEDEELSKLCKTISTGGLPDSGIDYETSKDTVIAIPTQTAHNISSDKVDGGPAQSWSSLDPASIESTF